MSVLDDYFRIGPSPQSDGSNLWSSLEAAIRDARYVTGRDEITGKVTDEQRTQRWLGAAGYLSLLDQLGSAVVPVGRATPKYAGQRFALAARTFGGITGDEKDALWALRNSLVHDFSLINIPANKKGPTLRAFSLTAVEHEWMVRHPSTRWNGRFPVASRSKTKVNVRELAERIEEAVANARKMHGNGELEAAVPRREFESRYFIRITPFSARLPLS